MDDDVKALLVGMAAGFTFALFLALALFGRVADRKDALCDRALATATASDSVTLAQLPYKCNLDRGKR